MPFATVKLTPGVRVEQTPTLLSANIVASQNIRWRGGLPEKIGGWERFSPTPTTVVGTIRAIWPWSDTNGTNHLAWAGDGGVQVLTGPNTIDITPHNAGGSIAGLTSVAGSSIITVTDVVITPIVGDAVVFTDHVSVGGVHLYGPYQIISVTPFTMYTIDSGMIATSSTSTWDAAAYNTFVGSNVIEVTFTAHGQSVGSTWAIPVAVHVDGCILQGFYTVFSVINANAFTIIDSVATGTTFRAAFPELIYYGFSTLSSPITAIDWSLSNFGSFLVINPQGGPIFTWNPIGNFTGAQPIAQAPNCTGSFIAMPQEQIIAYGAAVDLILDPMLVAWCDAGNYQVWRASASNQAGTYRLTRGSAIIGGIQGPQQAMLWTDVGMWLMQYIGYPDVYGFFEIAQGCGLIAMHAVAVVGSVVYWMGRSGFWIYSNGAVQPLPCEVWDTIFPTGLDRTNVENIRAAANTAYNEIAWYYPSAAGTGENDSYIRFNVLSGEWDFGSLAISAWVDDNIFGNPFSAMPDPVTPGNSIVMHMEQTNNANGAAISWSYTTGFFMLTEGEDKVFVDLVIPDFKWKRYNQSDHVSETINFTLFTSEYPDPAAGSGVATYGPYPVTSSTGAFETRARGRYFSAQISGNDLGKWSRLGGVKFRFSQDGRN